MTVEVGDEAPDFELRDQEGKPVRLSACRGAKNVLLVFYPLTFTRVCEGELCTIRDAPDAFSGPGTQTLAVSVDSVPAHARWAAEQGFNFPLLSDFWPHGEVAKRYGVFDEASGLAVRGSFVIDRGGRVVYKVVNAIPDARDAAEYREVLARLG